MGKNYCESKALKVARDITSFFDSTVRKEGTKVVVVDGYGLRTEYGSIKAMLLDWKPVLLEHMEADGSDFSSEVKFINRFAL